MFQRLRSHKKRLLISGIGLLIAIALYNQFSDSASQEIPSNEKKPFLIDTLTVGGKSGTGAIIEKRGKIQGSSDITVTSLVSGRVGSIKKTIGDTVLKSQLTIQLIDTYGTYQYATQRAGLSVDSAKNTYEQQVENLEKQLQDAQLAYERATLQSSTAKEDAAKQLEKAKYDLENVSAGSGSNTDLQVQKLEKDLEKASFDYETKIKADEQTRTNFVATAKNISSDIILLTQDVVFETDKILGVSDQNKNYNDAYESSLSATNTTYLYTAKDIFLALQRQQEQLASYDGKNITIENIEQKLTDYSNFLQPVINMLDAMEKVLINTVAGSSLSQTQLDLLKAQFDGYQAKAQATVSSITTQINTINSFLATYKDQQASLAKSVDLLKDQINITKKALADSEFATQVGFDRTQIGADNSTESARLGIESAKSALEYVRNTKSSTLKSIENSRKQAEVQYAEAAGNLAKFSVQTPVNGTITDVFVDIGQDVTPGTPLFRIVSDQHEIEVSLLASELPYIYVGQEVTATDEAGAIVSGNVVSVSDIGDKNGNFKAIIQLHTNSLKVGTFADVRIPLEDTITGVDVNVVRIVDNGIGEIFLRDGNTITKETVKLGNLLGQQIEIRSSLPSQTQIVLTNLDAFDPKTMEIQVKE